MEVSHPLIIVTKDDIKKARQLYDIDDASRIDESLKTVEEWCTKQAHLAEAYKHINRNILERLFVLARGSVEGTKTKIDKLLTSRSLMPELALNRNVMEFDRLWHAVTYVPLPKLCPTDQSRVMVTQFMTNDLDDFDLLSYFRYSFMVGEYRLHFDYTTSERYIIDLKNIRLGHISKVNPIVLKKSEVLCTEGFGTRIKGIHILNAPTFIDKLLFLLKQALREKVASRLYVHSSYEDLHKHIPKEILPKDYGGDEQSCAKLAEQWKENFKTDKAKEIVANFNKLVADESKRSCDKFNEEYMGMPGSFRKLNVD